jgi:hypothetical protein
MVAVPLPGEPPLSISDNVIVKLGFAPFPKRADR